MLTIVWLMAAPPRNQRRESPKAAWDLPTIHRFAITCRTYNKLVTRSAVANPPKGWDRPLSRATGAACQR